MARVATSEMTEQRALLTDTERAILSGDKDVKDNYRYSVESRVRTRLRDRLVDDVDILQKHQPEMYQILEEVACEDTGIDEMPLCSECGYRVMESSDDRGDYFCNECNAVLQEQHVRPHQTPKSEDIAESGSSEGAFDDFEPTDAGKTDAVEAESEFGAESNRTGTKAKEPPTTEPEPSPVDVDERLETDIEGVLEAVNFPSSKPREECVRAVRAAYDYLQREGPASMRDFVRDVMPDHPLGYDIPDLKPGERYRGSWWRKVVKPGLEALNNVEKPGRGGSEWEYVGGAND